MSDIDHNPVDPFANINLDELKQNTEKKIEEDDIVDKHAIKKAAEQNEFSSRQGTYKKQKLVTKTFSLFQDEIFIINNALKIYLEQSGDEDLSTPSNSDAVRAGLHLLAEKSPDEQAKLISQHRGRGRK